MCRKFSTPWTASSHVCCYPQKKVKMYLSICLSICLCVYLFVYRKALFVGEQEYNQEAKSCRLAGHSSRWWRLQYFSHSGHYWACCWSSSPLMASCLGSLVSLVLEEKLSPRAASRQEAMYHMSVSWSWQVPQSLGCREAEKKRFGFFFFFNVAHVISKNSLTNLKSWRFVYISFLKVLWF